MRPSFRSGISGLFILFFVGALIGLVALSFLFYRNSVTYQNTSAWLLQTRDFIAGVQKLSFLAKGVQWESNNYMLTKDNGALITYQENRDSLLERMAGLMHISENAAARRSEFDELKKNIERMLAYCDQLIAKRRSLVNIPLGGMIESIKVQEGYYMEISQQVDTITNNENRQLQFRRSLNMQLNSQTYFIFTTLAALAVLFLGVGFFLLRHYFKKRQRAESQLIESERKFHQLLDSTKDIGIFMTDKQGNIQSWYEGALRIKGYSKEEIIGKNISIFYTPEAIAEHEPEDNLKSALANGSFKKEGWRIRKDGSRFWADVLITPVFDPDGRLEGFTKITRDFSLHKKAEDDFKVAFDKERELNLMKSNFVSIASHEFRTPLSTILSSASLLEIYNSTDPQQDKKNRHIQKIKSAVNDMVGTLEEFLSLEKIEEGKLVLNRENVNVRELSRALIATTSHADQSGQAFSYFHKGAEEFYIDKNSIEHILINLLSNAIKYSPSNSVIDVITCIEKDSFTLSVRDQGIGISIADQQHLFERFFRASNTGSVKGTGLGLHIVKRYVDLIGGSITLSSAVNEGSEFTVRIPSHD